jgi:hypothetical protein
MIGDHQPGLLGTQHGAVQSFRHLAGLFSAAFLRAPDPLLLALGQTTTGHTASAARKAARAVVGIQVNSRWQ